MSYVASEELVNILLKNGFVECTEKHYPEHFERLNVIGYDPYSVKRMFFKKSKRNYILFDYVNIRLNDGTPGKLSFSEKELKSLLVFYTLSFTDKRKLYGEGYSALTIYKKVDYLNDLHPYQKMYVFDKKIMRAFQDQDILIETLNGSNHL